MIYILAFLDPWLRFLRFQMSDLGGLSSLCEIVRDHTGQRLAVGGPRHTLSLSSEKLNASEMMTFSVSAFAA